MRIKNNLEEAREKMCIGTTWIELGITIQGFMMYSWHLKQYERILWGTVKERLGMQIVSI